MIDTALPVLYSFRRCPYAIRTRITLLYSRQAVELREVVLRNKPPCMIEYSPKATVPVLVLSDHTVLEESLDIIYWALNKNDPEQWWQGLSIEQQQLTSTLIQQNDGPFKHWLDRYKYADRYPQESAEHYRQQAQTYLAQLEQQLSRQPYLLTDRLTLADIAIFPFIRQFAFVDKNWFDQSPYPHLQRWLNALLGSPLFTEAMVKYAPWEPNHNPVIFSRSE